MQYQGYEDYLLAAGLANLNPVARQQFEDEDVEFNPAHSFVPGMNSPQFAQSTVIRQVRKPAHTDISFVRLGNNGYTYPMTDEQLARFMTSQSLAGYYNAYLKRK